MTTHQQLIDKLAPFSLGLVRGTLSLQPQQKKWTEAFLLIKKELQQVHGSIGYQMHHIGSSNIPGCLSKPILDMLLIYEDTDHFNSIIGAIESLGFTYRGDMVNVVQNKPTDQDRHAFNLYSVHKEVDYVHLHALKKGHKAVGEQLAFGQELCQNPQLVVDYNALKKHLFDQGLSRREYTLAKGEFVNGVCSKAAFKLLIR